MKSKDKEAIQGLKWEVEWLRSELHAWWEWWSADGCTTPAAKLDQANESVREWLSMDPEHASLAADDRHSHRTSEAEKDGMEEVTKVVAESDRAEGAFTLQRAAEADEDQSATITDIVAADELHRREACQIEEVYVSLLSTVETSS